MVKLCALADKTFKTVENLISAFKREEITLIEIESLDGNDISSITESQAREYAELFAKEGIEVWSVASELGMVGTDNDFSEYIPNIHNICRLANIFGAKRVRLFGFCSDNENEVVKRLRITVVIAEAYGIGVCLENNENTFAKTPERVLSLISGIKDLYVIFNVAAYLKAGVDTVKAKVELYRRVDYYRANDFCTEAGEKVLPGKGDGNIHDILNDLCKEEDRVLVFEPSTESLSKLEYTENDNAGDGVSFGFDASCDNIKSVLLNCGYREFNGVWKK